MVRIEIETRTDIVDQVPNGGGGEGNEELTNGTFRISLDYETLPTGVLTLQVSNLMLIGDPVLWQGQWSPTAR